MSLLRKVAQKVRHAPVLSSAEGLMSSLRGPYQRLLNWHGRGVAITLSGGRTVRMPPEYTGVYWETYEPESVRATVAWATHHPDGLLLDVGSAIGFYSLLGLFSSEQMRVIAFDSDIASLKATRRMCRYATGDRLSLVHGFLSENHASGQKLESAGAQTEASLAASPSTGDPGTTIYICIEDNKDKTIPTHSLDGLLRGNSLVRRPVLLKCDVEGAELLVLRGAQDLLKRNDVTLSLSVHPPALPKYGHSPDQVRRFLEVAGYRIQKIAEDHEEHWWCEKPSKPQ